MPTRRTLLFSGLAIGTLPLWPAALRAQDLVVVRRGSFTGASGHVTSGSGAITREGGRFYVSLGSDFAFDGAPDPKVALGRDGYRQDTLLGPLQANAGAQTYVLPDAIDAEAHNEIWIWCEEFNVPLGVAQLE